jgi:hypothetical protein
MLNTLGYRKGKDTIADYFCKEYGYHKISFAEPMKKILSITLGVDEEELEIYKNEPQKYKIVVKKYIHGSIVEKEIHNAREQLQFYGTEGMKGIFGDDVWVKLASKRIIDLNRNEGINRFIIPDFRFEIEYNMKKLLSDCCKELLTIQIKNDSVENKDTHSSENELRGFNFDHYLDNTFMDETIFNQIDDLMKGK